MGIITAAISSIDGALADQWLEVIEPYEMSDQTVFTSGVTVRPGDKRNSNEGTQNVVSNGSIIHVYPNQFMMLVDGGKIVDYSAEEGYYKVENSSAPSLFNGQFGDSLRDVFNRFKFSGVTPGQQKVYYINLQEIKGIKFGTRNPINYFDNFYNAELFLRAHGSFSIKVKDPILFYSEVIPRNMDRVEMDDIREQYLSEFMEAFQGTINQMSVDGIRISHVPSHGREVSRYMADILDASWRKDRGMEIQSVGIASISYDDESTKLINMRNQGAMLGDPAIREGYVQGAVARGLEAAGSNEAGSVAGFMGIGMGMQAGGGYMGAVSQNNIQQAQHAAQQNQAEPSIANEKPNEWKCDCGTPNSGKFCTECGKGRLPQKCQKCGHIVPQDHPASKFCPECGASLTE